MESLRALFLGSHRKFALHFDPLLVPTESTELTPFDMTLPIRHDNICAVKHTIFIEKCFWMPPEGNGEKY